MKLIRFYKPIVWTAIITYLCLMPADDLPKVPLFGIPHLDKLVHAGMYFILVVFLIKPLKSITRQDYLYTLIISVLVGGVIEIIQAFFTRNRSGSLYDLFADFGGAILGLLFFRYFIQGRKMEKFL